MATGAVSAILLAAGRASRMGKLKQLMPLGESTILEQTLDNLLASKVSEVIVVLGYKAEEITRRLSGRPAKVVVNPLYRKGIGTSIAAGLKFVEPEATFYFWVLIPDGESSESFAEMLLKKAHIVATPGNGFGVSGEGYVRLTLCTTEERLKEAGERIVSAMK